MDPLTTVCSHKVLGVACPVVGLVGVAWGWASSVGIISSMTMGADGYTSSHWCIAAVSITTLYYSCAIVLLMRCMCKVACILTAYRQCCTI